jgi:hypothetical protein
VLRRELTFIVEGTISQIIIVIRILTVKLRVAAAFTL